MRSFFPECITTLPQAEIPLQGVNIYVSQAPHHQIVFMEFHEDVEIPKHSHRAQWETVLKGSVDVWIDDKKHSYQKGNQFYIPSGVVHHALVPKGYAAMAFFDEPQRYKIKQ